MSKASPLPADLRGRPFAVAEAFALGASRSRLRAHDLVRPTRGVRVPRDAQPAEPGSAAGAESRMLRLTADLEQRARAFAPALTNEQFFSGSTGLLLLGVPVPYTRAAQLDLHIAARRPAGMPRRSGAVGHRFAERTPHRGVIRGLPIEHPARLWTQAAAEWSVDDLIVAGDHLVQPRNRLTTLAALREEVASTRLHRQKLEQALDEIRVGAESPEESRLRLLVVRAGLPEPELNWQLRDAQGDDVARLDIAWPRFRTAAEYDGRVHAFDDRQFARDADRWHDIERAGWSLVRILSHHVRPDPAVALARISDALVRAGWRPGIR